MTDGLAARRFARPSELATDRADRIHPGRAGPARGSAKRVKCSPGPLLVSGHDAEVDGLDLSLDDAWVVRGNKAAQVFIRSHARTGEATPRVSYKLINW